MTRQNSITSRPTLPDSSTLPASTYPGVDLALARRLERAEAMANAACVDSRRTLQPEVGAEWTQVAGVYAMFDGPASPITQTFGLGLFEPFREREFDQIEEFFASRGAPTFHEVSSFVAPDTLNLLSVRGYAPIETTTVLVRPTPPAHAQDSTAITVRTVGEGDAPTWCRISAEGWGSESEDLRAFLESSGAVMTQARDVTCFLADLEGKPVAAAAMHITNGTALLAGAATIPAARRRGAQLALLHARLAFASARGIDLAMVVTQPGTASQRNAQRQGFRPVYTRAKWQLAAAT